MALLLTNKGECVFVLGDKNLVPGEVAIEVTQDEANHPTVQAYVKAGKLELTEPVPAVKSKAKAGE